MPFMGAIYNSTAPNCPGIFSQFPQMQKVTFYVTGALVAQKLLIHNSVASKS
jgi:hypothetical protein